MKIRQKIVLEERISTLVGGKVVGGMQRVLSGGKSRFHQEVVYLGFILGDAVTYGSNDQVRMLDGAKRLLWELASGGASVGDGEKKERRNCQKPRGLPSQ